MICIFGKAFCLHLKKKEFQIVLDLQSQIRTGDYNNHYFTIDNTDTFTQVVVDKM